MSLTTTLIPTTAIMDNFDETLAMYPTSMPPFDASPTPMLPAFDSIDSNYQFDVESFAGSDGTHAHLGRLPSTYDEAFSDVVSNYDQSYAPEPSSSNDNPALDRDNKLLNFSMPTFPYTLLDYTYRRAAISLTSQLNGMFFMADAPTSGGDEGAPPRVAVTCYRRNLFSISGSITMPRSMRYISTDQGDQVPIATSEIALSATESIEGSPVKLISVPFKSSMTTGGIEERADKEPHPIPVDLMSGAEMDPEFATFPIAWKRLQFRASTANNGRRKELQQHFVIHISVMATLSTGQKISICDIASNPIVVRGRSPRNFAGRKEGGGPTSGSISRIKPSRQSTGDSIQMANPKVDADFGTAEAAQHEFPPTSDPWGWRPTPDEHPNGNHHAGGAVPALPLDTFRIPPNDFFAQSNPDLSRYTPQPNAPAPINLSLIDEDSKRPSLSPSGAIRSNNGTPTVRKAPRLSQSQHRAPSFSMSTLHASSDADADATDPLYEYFPLGLDDWQEPVDAVYRPHIVHHIKLPSDSKSSGTKGRSKRLFSAASP